jgi:hypothetical protein
MLFQYNIKMLFMIIICKTNDNEFSLNFNSIYLDSRLTSNNSNKSPIRCNNFSVYYPDFYLQLSKFRAFSRPLSGAQWLQWQPLVLPSYRGDSRAGRASQPDRHDYHHDKKVKPEAATAVIGLLMMGGKTPETCWAVNKCQDNKLKNCCIGLVIYLN